MICTFGDVTDVVWWRELDLPTRSIVDPVGADRRDPARRRARRARPGRPSPGATVKQAQRAMVEMLGRVGRPDRRAPAHHAPGQVLREGRPPRSRSSPAGSGSSATAGTTSAAPRAARARRRELDWHPPYMQVRYDDWVNGLNGDWLVSRQRYFGVPFPVWYPLGADGEPDYAAPIVPDEASLPVDPTTDVPARLRRRPARRARRLRRRSRRHGHLGHLLADAADRLRVGGRSGAVRGHLPHGPAPAGARDHPHLALLDAAALAPRARRAALARTPPSTAGSSTRTARRCPSRRATWSRPWPCSRSSAPMPCATGPATGGPGPTPPLDTGVMKIGRRLAIKILNASKFALGRLGDGPLPGTDAVARAPRRRAAGTAGRTRRGGHGGPRGLRLRPGPRGHRDVLLVLLRRLRRAGQDAAPTARATPPATASARATLALALSVLHRLFAPFLPFVTEEVWSWWQEGSVHLAPWPSVAELGTPADADPTVLSVAAEVLGAVRREKTAHKRSMRARVARLMVTGPPATLAAVEAARGDLIDAGGVDELVVAEGDALSCRGGARRGGLTPRVRGRPTAPRRPSPAACPRARCDRAA